MKEVGMRGITIDAKTLRSAQALYEALYAFRPELTGSEDEGYRVTVEFGDSARQIDSILNALQEHVTQRATGPTRLELDGRRYTMFSQEPATDLPTP
jgi:hypothetical protein